jgi:hypothetical protein
MLIEVSFHLPVLTFEYLQVVRKCRLEEIIREDNRLLEAPGITAFPRHSFNYSIFPNLLINIT